MRSSTSMISISTMGERPPSRASITTVTSVISGDQQSLAGEGRRTSIDSETNKPGMTGYQRSVSRKKRRLYSFF